MLRRHILIQTYSKSIVKTYVDETTHIVNTHVKNTHVKTHAESTHVKDTTYVVKHMLSDHVDDHVK